MLLVLAVVAVVLVFVPGGMDGASFGANAVESLGLGVAVVVLVRAPPDPRGAWWVVVAGYVACAVGDWLWSWQYLVVPELFPGPADALYLGGGAGIAVGAFLLVRTGDAATDRAGLMDAAIVTCGAVVVLAVFVVGPLWEGAGDGGWSRLVVVAYPVIDVLQLSLLARLWTAPSSRTPAFRWLMVSLLLTSCSDVLYSSPLAGSSRVFDVVTTVMWTGSYLTLATAAVAAAGHGGGWQVQREQRHGGLHRRLVVVGTGLSLPAAAMLWESWGRHEVRWSVLSGGSLVISALVVLRFASLMARVEEQAATLGRLASVDALTGAPNRRTWDTELAAAARVARAQGTSLYVALVDLDHFKVYNDTHGHQAGDALLRESVQAWRGCLPASAVLARYGGEEFAVLLPGLAAQEALGVLERVRASVPRGCTASAGLARWVPGTEPEQALADADAALYRAKRAGRDRTVVASDEEVGDPGGAGAAPGPVPSVPAPRAPGARYRRVGPDG